MDLAATQSSGASGLAPGALSATRVKKPRQTSSIAQSSFVPRRQPFLYLTAALITGIVIETGLEPAFWLIWSLAAISFGLAISSVALQRRIALATLLIGFAAAGAALSRADREVSSSRLKQLYQSGVITPDRPVELLGVLRKPPEPAPGLYYLEIDAVSVRIGDNVIRATGVARLMISVVGEDAGREFRALSLELGSRVRMLIRLEKARTYYNPGSPDFNEFLERQGYDLKGTIKSPLLIERVGHARGNPLLAVLYGARLRLIGAIDASFAEPVAGTLKAMLTGNQYFLNSEVMDRLRQASTFHTLVISGMNIGLIVWTVLGLGSAWGLRRSSRAGARVSLITLSLVALWGYTVMVGLAPPVTRAAVMITVGLIGPLLFRRVASLNTVSFAAFLMLALKPALAADPGFQLSFAAVVAIAAFALPIARRLRAIGQWRPTAAEPHPPSCPRPMRLVAEALFWDELGFQAEMKGAPVRYRMKKCRAAIVFTRLRLQSLLRATMLLLITSSAIQLMTLPLMAAYFNRVAPIGVLLNVFAGVLTSGMMISGLITIMAEQVNAGLAAKLAMLVSGGHYLLVNSVSPFTGLPGATFRVAHYEGWSSILYVIYFAPLALIAVIIDRWKPIDRCLPVDRTNAHRPDAVNRILEPGKPARLVGPQVFASLCVGLMAVTLIAVVHPVAGAPGGKLTIHFLDVGQGDSALVVFPSGTTMLIDGGGEMRLAKTVNNQTQVSEIELQFRERDFSVGEAVVSRFVWSLRRTRIDYVLATHADSDHIDGLSDAIKNFRVLQAIVGNVPIADKEFDGFEKELERSGVLLASVKAGDRFEVEGVVVEVLWPRQSAEAPVTSGNDDSVVLRLVYGSTAVLLTGDIERKAEEELVHYGADLRSDILKVPHHGSRTSSTDVFLDSVKPRYAVISVGERSRFGHPHPSVVRRYDEREIELLQTGHDGTVTVETDGQSIEVRTFRK